MYQALYRKYRPTNFNEVVGQKVIKQTLQNAIIKNRISHAYLFCGPRGTGKTTVAKIIAKTVNCLHNGNGYACNECKNCIQFQNKQTTDIIEIDAASNNGVDEIREIKNKVSLVPNSGKYKIYIIDEVHMLTVGAFNALLKTLEEPPEHIIFILATTEPHKIPMTILSRCQRFDFKKITDDQIVERLKYIVEKEKINISENALKEIAHLSDGGMRDSISLLDQAVAYTENVITINDIHDINGTLTKEELKYFTEKMLDGNINDILMLLDEYDEKGKNLVKFAEEFMVFLKNALLMKKIPDYFEKKEIYNIGNNFNEHEIINYIDEFNTVLNKMKTSDHPKLLLEVCIIKNITNKSTQKESFNNISQQQIEVTKESAKNKISEEIINEKNDQKNEAFDEKMIDLVNLRINNTLAEFKKTYLQYAKNRIDTVREYIFDAEYNQIATLILDGNLRAASEKNLIFVFENEWQSKEFNHNILKIEELLKKIYNKEYAVISTFSNQWDIIKNEFNNKKNSYIYTKEPEEIKQILLQKEDKNLIEETFGDIIEYV